MLTSSCSKKRTQQKLLTGEAYLNFIEKVCTSDEVLRCNKFAEIADLIPPPGTVAELESRIRTLVQSTRNDGWTPAPPCIVKRGTAWAGNFLEWLLGSQGKNNSFGDTLGHEVKWHGIYTSTLITLFHQDPVGGVHSLMPLLTKYPTKEADKKGRRSLRITITPTSPWRVTAKKDRLIICRRNPADNDPEIYWLRNTLLNRALKFKNTLLVLGIGDFKHRRIRFDVALKLDMFDIDNMIHNVLNDYMRVDLDYHEKEPRSNTLRNHGTKFRFKYDHANHLWERVTLVGRRTGLLPEKLIKKTDALVK